VVIFIDGDTGHVTSRPQLARRCRFASEIGNVLTDVRDGDEKGKRGISVLSAGQAAEHIRASR
jgi:hypothetical protein